MTLLAGRYEVRETLLEGRFSSLLRVDDRLEGEPACVRSFRTAGAEEARLQVLREGRFLARLEHPGLPRVQRVIEDGGLVLLVMEDLSGPTLEAVVAERGRVDADTLHRWIDSLLHLLEYLHGQSPPVLVRDLRPDTLLAVGPRLVAAEFGLARMVEEGGAEATVFRAQGSPCYAAPEQLLGHPSQPAIDLYAAGAVAWFLATGQPPPRSLELFSGSSALPALRDLRPDLPEPVARLVGALMAPRPEGRPGSAGEARRSLLLSLPVGPGSVSLRRAAGGAAPGAKPSMWEMIFGAAAPGRVAAAEQSGPDEADLARFPRVDLENLPLDREVALLLPEQVSRSIQGICVGRPSPGEITVAVKDPTQVHVYDHVSFATQGRLRPVLVRAEPALVDLARDYVYRSRGPTPWLEWLERKKYAGDTLDVRTGPDLGGFGSAEITSPVVEAVDRVLKEAISAGASDIHLETGEEHLEVRYRIDGVLHAVERFTRRQAPALVKRVKILAGMDIAQERVTQGGRISLSLKDQEYDLRVSVIPVVNGGEDIVMRLLRKGSFDLRLPDLGFGPDLEPAFRRLLAQPYGMILVSGPTGSGKSTTLYASLAEIVRPDRKLLTVEDPVEYRMAGVSQVQVNLAPREEERRVTFSRALREFLRQDPDVILVGEIRDAETAAISVQAALTGHLLLSTIHTNDSIGIVARLRDMGVESFLLGSTLIGGLAQRLVRKVCSGCAEPVPLTDSLRALFDGAGIADPRPMRGRGCRRCHDTGCRGRMGLFELLSVSPEIREQIGAGAREAEIRAAAGREGFRPLYRDGLEKAARGQVTVDEVQRVSLTL